ncbi:Tyrosinase-like protein orsC [Apiospora phragmitis]|uniref:Tyrosinase-like protein orsC n=1 Tax=Apiospora phragmitis TaxID=2905665 RepID=A0ABR1VQV3_9PEZI
MHFDSLVYSVLVALTQVGFASSRLLGDANPTKDVACQQPLIRREWRTLSTSERQGFISTVRCLQSKPGQTSDIFDGVKSRYDDFLALHITQTDYVHWVVSTLFPFQLASKYWTRDAVSEKAVVESPIFDPIHGFGGNGPYIANTTGFPEDWQTMTPVPNRTGGGCIEDGPFVHVNVSMGPGNHTGYTPHCLRRDLSPWLVTQALNASKLAFVMEAEDFWHLDHRIEGFSLEIADMSLHGGAHLGLEEILERWQTPIRLLPTPFSGCTIRLWIEFGTCGKSKTRKSDIGGPDTQVYGPLTNGPIRITILATYLIRTSLSRRPSTLDKSAEF